MVAVLNPIPSDRLDHFQAQRPALRVITGGRDRSGRRTEVRRQPSAATYRRRRVFAALAVLTVVGLAVVLLLGAASLVSGSSSTAATSGASLAAASPIGTTSYVVQPGDTLWAIATKLAPSGDVRSLVDQLADRQGGSALEAGQRLDLTGLSL